MGDPWGGEPTIQNSRKKAQKTQKKDEEKISRNDAKPQRGDESLNSRKRAQKNKPQNNRRLTQMGPGDGRH
jgi:hypothetical protein